MTRCHPSGRALGHACSCACAFWAALRARVAFFWGGALAVGLCLGACSTIRGKSDTPAVASETEASQVRPPGSPKRVAPHDPSTPSSLSAKARKVSGSLKPIAVVELFTSEGCSSCPSADRVLVRLEQQARARQRNVLALAFHVDYWNRLGWRDRFSDRAYSDRQRWYALQQPEPRVYTPQMVVQGTEQFIGSHEQTARLAIDQILKRPARAKVSLTAEGLAAGRWQIGYRVELAAPEDHLTVALVQRHAQSQVTAGENSGATLEHANVVLDYARKPVDSGRGSWRATGASGVGVSVMAFVQQAKSLEVLGGNQLEL